MDEKSNRSTLFYLPVPEVKVQDLLDWRDPNQRQHRHLVQRQPRNELKVTFDSLINSHHHKKCFGQSVKINDETIALFRVGEEVHATQAKCPHMGGPLHLADIEELVVGSLTLRCPWHKWTFDLDTGRCITPKGREISARTYPVKVNPSGEIRIGFDSFGPSAFAEQDF